MLRLSCVVVGVEVLTIQHRGQHEEQHDQEQHQGQHREQNKIQFQNNLITVRCSLIVIGLVVLEYVQNHHTITGQKIVKRFAQTARIIVRSIVSANKHFVTLHISN